MSSYSLVRAWTNKRVERTAVRVTALGSESHSLHAISYLDDGWAMSHSLFLSCYCLQQITKQNIGLRVPRFERTVVRRAGNGPSRTMRFGFNALASLVKTPALTLKHRALQKSHMGLINYKQMPINHGHPLGFHPGASRSN